MDEYRPVWDLEQRIAWVRRREERERKALYPAEVCLWECRVVVGKYSKWITLGTTSQPEHPKWHHLSLSLHLKHITLFITSSQLDHPGCHGNPTTSLWVPPQSRAHPVSTPQPTPPSQSPQLFALVSQRPVPAGAGGGRIPWMALSSRCRAARACCLFSLCLTAALWILLLPRLWTVGPAQETQPNIYLPLFDLKQLQKGWKSVHQHPANPTFPPARESKQWKS